MTAKPTPEMVKPAAQRRPPLGRSDDEQVFLDFEQAMICAGEAFYRYAAGLLGETGRVNNLTGQDHVILQQLIFSVKPRGVTELSRFANREDTSNIQYSLRKLMAAGLVEKVKGVTNRDTAYKPTEAAMVLHEDIVAVRRALIVAPAEHVRDIAGQLSAATTALSLLTGLYDHASRVMAGGGPPRAP